MSGERVDRDHPDGFADCQHQRVGGDEGVGVRYPAGRVRKAAAGASSWPAVWLIRELERFSMPDDSTSLGDLSLRSWREAPQRGSHPPGAGSQQVSSRDRAGQGAFGALAPLPQLLGEVGAFPQFGHGHIEGAGSGIEGPLTVAVAPVGLGL